MPCGVRDIGFHGPGLRLNEYLENRQGGLSLIASAAPVLAAGGEAGSRGGLGQATITAKNRIMIYGPKDGRYTMTKRTGGRTRQNSVARKIADRIVRAAERSQS